MPVLVRIALRNLLEHKAKTIIVGAIVAVGIAVLIVGESFTAASAMGVRRLFIDNYTAHVMVSGIADGPISLFGVQSPGAVQETPVIPDYEKVRAHVEGIPGVAAVTPQISGYARMRYRDYPGWAFSLLFGIEPQSYRRLFDNISFVEGRDLRPGEAGILLSTERVAELKTQVTARALRDQGKDPAVEIHVGDTIRLTSFGYIGIKIREVPIVGIFQFKQASEGVGIDLISYVDVETLRALRGLTLGSRGGYTLRESETALLAMDNVEDIFAKGGATIEEAGVSGKLTDRKLRDILGDTAARQEALKQDVGAWNYLLIKLDNPRQADRLMGGLNDWFVANGLAAHAGTWQAAAGPFSTTADVIRTVFTIAVIILGIVALIIIMNTLVISVLERTGEIGTMRALGARKGFVWRMFLYETLVICVVFGLLGILLSVVAVGIVNLLRVPATNVFLRIIFGGAELHPTVGVVSILVALGVVVMIGFLGNLYPVSIALRIPAVRAMHTE
ncbi:MAG: ABC transporter permease [Planctomycetota bacterium]